MYSDCLSGHGLLRFLSARNAHFPAWTAGRALNKARERSSPYKTVQPWHWQHTSFPNWRADRFEGLMRPLLLKRLTQAHLIMPAWITRLFVCRRTAGLLCQVCVVYNGRIRPRAWVWTHVRCFTTHDIWMPLFSTEWTRPANCVQKAYRMFTGASNVSAPNLRIPVTRDRSKLSRPAVVSWWASSHCYNSRINYYTSIIPATATRVFAWAGNEFHLNDLVAIRVSVATYVTDCLVFFKPDFGFAQYHWQLDCQSDFLTTFVTHQKLKVDNFDTYFLDQHAQFQKHQDTEVAI